MSARENAHEQEARERWGNTEAWRESRRRTRSYTPEQVETIQAELESIEADFAVLLKGGEPPHGPQARAVAERARLHIDRWYYPCSPPMHEALAEMYVSDPRFRAHYEDRSEGLAAFVAAAIRSNAAGEPVG